MKGKAMTRVRRWLAEFVECVLGQLTGGASPIEGVIVLLCIAVVFSLAMGWLR